MMSIYSILVSIYVITRIGDSLRFAGCSSSQNNILTRLNSKLITNDIIADEHATYLQNIALVQPPARLGTLLSLLQISGEQIIPPRQRGNLNPFLIPLSRNVDGGVLAYIRWPTQKESMDLQLVRTTESGVKLVSMGTDNLCKRIVVEMDFYSKPKAEEAIELLNRNGKVYEKGDYMPLLKSGKFPTITAEDLRLVLDRFLLTKVGPFPDCYENLAQDYIKKGDVTSGLVTCERAVSVFYGWGHPMTFQAQLLSKMASRDKEARDVARAALSSPVWTLGNSVQEIDGLAKIAGFSGAAIVGEMHAYRAKDPRTDEIGEGLSPIQVTLDQVAHFMDAIALGAEPGGWQMAREKIASMYSEGGYPQLAKLILDYDQ